MEFYPNFVDKVAVLVAHIARNHPLPDWERRLAWVALTMFCAINGQQLSARTDDAAALMLAIASGEQNVGAVTAWLAERVHSGNGYSRRLQYRVAGSSPLESLFLIPVAPLVERGAASPEIPARLGDVAGHLLGVLQHRHPVVHYPSLISFRHRFSLSSQRTHM
ncbi:MAG: hypothetical protein M3112_09290 [Actinomycetia bacterium]|nr:hypothetical protein [Actinomycetes bacterium]